MTTIQTLTISSSPMTSTSSKQHTIGKAPDAISATITNYGARLMSLNIPDRQGHATDVVLGKSTPIEYAGDSSLMGGIVGRNANRLANAQCTIDGRIYQLKHNDGRNNNHSGPDGYEHRSWEITRFEQNAAELRLDSPHMDQGLPGRFVVTVRYTLMGSTLRLSIRGHSDRTTLANLTTHTYWNLDGEGSGDIYGHQLRIPANRYYPTDREFLPIGCAPVLGTPMDFQSIRRIGDMGGFHREPGDQRGQDEQLQIARGYNHTFSVPGFVGVANNCNGDTTDAAPSTRHMATAIAARSGIRMDMFSNAPTVLLYTAGFLGPTNGKREHRYNDGGGFCLEPGFVPNAVNMPNEHSPILTANVPYQLDVIYRFSFTNANTNGSANIRLRAD